MRRRSPQRLLKSNENEERQEKMLIKLAFEQFPASDYAKKGSKKLAVKIFSLRRRKSERHGSTSGGKRATKLILRREG